MTTEQEYQQKIQTMRNMGIPESEIQRELGLQVGAERAQADRAARVAAEAANPQPAPPLAMPYSDRHLRVFDAQMANAAQEQAADARDWAELEQIDAEIERLMAPLRQRRAVVAERINRRRMN